jgi:uncharacterized protein
MGAPGDRGHVAAGTAGSAASTDRTAGDGGAVTAPAASPVRLPVMLQRWEAITFVHWRYDAAALRPVLPRGLEPEVCDGSAWVGLVLFRLRIAPPGVAAAFALNSVPEMNLRTYVVDPDRRPAVWFLSLDVGNRVLAVGGRSLYRLPYHHADMSVERERGTTVYRSHRRDRRRPADVSVRVRIGERIPQRSLRRLDHFLTARFQLVTSAGPLLLRAPVEHRSWQLRRADVTEIEETLVPAAGLSPTAGEPVIHAADPVEVRIGVLRPIVRTRRRPSP